MLWFKLVYSYANSTLFCLKNGSPPSQALLQTLGVWEVAFKWHQKKWEGISQVWLERIDVLLYVFLMLSPGA